MDPQALQGWAMIALTILLVLVTAWYALHTRRLADTAEIAANQSAEAAGADQRSALAAELGLRIQNLPVVIPELVKTAQQGRQILIKNVGNTAATNVEVFVETGDGSRVWNQAVPRILEPTGASVSIPFEQDSIPLATHVRAIIGVRYEDPSGHVYRFEQPYQGSSPVRLLRREQGTWVPFLPEG